MKIRKGLYLMLALVLPVLIFLFLKFFGKNEFDVPSLFQERVDVNSDCRFEYTFPYEIPDSIAETFQIERNKLAVIVFLEDNLSDDVHKQRNRIDEEFSKDPVVIRNVDASDKSFSFLKKCIFLMPAQSNVVLIDNEKRLRGQYNVTSLEDMDRLIVEMKIILKRY